jgi:hypothetical protein
MWYWNFTLPETLGYWCYIIGLLHAEILIKYRLIPNTK